MAVRDVQGEAIEGLDGGRTLNDGGRERMNGFVSAVSNWSAVSNRWNGKNPDLPKWQFCVFGTDKA
jgi:hypothetical protein